jgi:uncharacterized protein
MALAAKALFLLLIMARIFFRFMAQPCGILSPLDQSSKKRYIYYTLDFEFDSAKSVSNKAKHGIDFREAQNLWQDQLRLIVPARITDEVRFAIIAAWDAKLGTGVFTLRDGAIRLISVRRAREEEKTLYESAGL